MKAEKAAKYKELKQAKNKKLFEEWFLSYKPDDVKNSKEEIKNIKKTKRKRNKTKKSNLFNLYNSNKSRKNRKNLY
jgi:hypothetical protein